MEVEGEQEPHGFLSRARSVLRRAVNFWTSRPLLLAAVAGLVATIVVFGGMRTLAWMETPDFCGRCHTMAPEVSAHANSPHETVECAECHVGSGLSGLVTAKLGGMRQMIKLALGDYARPIPPASHGMPAASETCLRCHDPARQRQDLLVTRSHFEDDESNTQQRVALVVRLSSGPEQPTQGIHWHVLSQVEYLAADKESRVIDWIGVDRPDGTHEEFISDNVVDVSEQAGQRAAELRLGGDIHRMSCYDCHNRVGHEFPAARHAIDDALAEQRIDPSIPFIKKRGLDVISTKYSSQADADRAINALEKSYHQEYPNLLLERPDKLKQSFAVLAQLYRQTSNPVMNAAPDNYPSYLGHTDTAGCFRCHDGGHFKIVDGRLSNEPIPSQCSLCHTFPSIGQQSPNVMLGPPPASHEARLWVFQHKTAIASSDPAQTTCGNCHSRTYCSNCHSTGATQVKHDNMKFDHAAVIRETGEQPCAYCHQKAFCERCHEEKANP